MHSAEMKRFGTERASEAPRCLGWERRPNDCENSSSWDRDCREICLPLHTISYHQPVTVN